MRVRRCPVCRTKFLPDRPTQKCCTDPDCALTLGRQISEKAARLADRQKRIDMKTMAQLRHDAQFWVNRYVRLRDAHLPCIACGCRIEGGGHAGHYMSVGAHPELRFEADLNIHRTCAACNTHLSGNLIEYRKGMVLRYGQGMVDWLEGPHDARHYTREDLRAIAQDYRNRCREVEKKC
jgi:hypothetical protein